MKISAIPSEKLESHEESPTYPPIRLNEEDRQESISLNVPREAKNDEIREIDTSEPPIPPCFSEEESRAKSITEKNGEEEKITEMQNETITANKKRDVRGNLLDEQKKLKWFDEGRVCALEDRFATYHLQNEEREVQERENCSARSNKTKKQERIKVIGDEYISFFVNVDVEKLATCKDRVRHTDEEHRESNKFSKLFLSPKCYGDNHSYISVCCLALPKDKTIEVISLYKANSHNKRISLHNLPREHESLSSAINRCGITIIDGIRRHSALC